MYWTVLIILLINGETCTYKFVQGPKLAVAHVLGHQTHTLIPSCFLLHFFLVFLDTFLIQLQSFLATPLNLNNGSSTHCCGLSAGPDVGDSIGDLDGLEEVAAAVGELL